MWDIAGEARTKSCDNLLWTPAHGRASVGRPSRTYLRQLCPDLGCRPADWPGAMDDRDEWKEIDSQGNPCY